MCLRSVLSVNQCSQSHVFFSRTSCNPAQSWSFCVSVLLVEHGAAGQCCIAPGSYPQPVAVFSHVYPIWFLFICTCILSLFSTTVNIYNERLCNMLQILKTGNAINMKNIQRNSMFLSVKSAWQTHLYKLSSLSFGCLPLMACAHSSAFLLFPVEKEQHLSLSSLWHIHCVHI